LGAEYIHDREEMKKAISLAEIQHTYFTFLQDNFGEFYRAMVDHGLTPHDAATALSRSASSIDELTKKLRGFLEAVEEFWAQASEVAQAHVEDMHDVLKGVFGGDLFPSHNENIASKCGVYIDTLVLPDPFMRSKFLFQRWKPERQAYYLVKHGLNLLQYRELACADVSPPVVVILPDNTALEQDEGQFFLQLGQRDAVVHATKVFRRPFDSFDDLKEFASSLDTVDRVVREVAEPNRVLFDTQWKGSLKEQLERACTDELAELLGTKNPGVIVAAQAVGRMSVSNELLAKAYRLRGTPIIEAATSWQYFVWKLEYDAENLEREANFPDLHVVRALESVAHNEMQWLGRVPAEALIELRKTKAIQEIRTILAKGVKELSLTNPANFHRTTEQVFENIRAAFQQHRKGIDELSSKKWRFARSDIGSWLVVGSLLVTAAATGVPFWGILAIAADQVLDAPKLRSIPKSIQGLARETQRLRQSPVGMLFKYGGRTA
jgi:hypothetical protein